MLTFYKFYAPWCGPCQRMSPIVDALQGLEQHKDVAFQSIDIDAPENAALVETFGVMGLPTMVVAKGDVLLAKQTGVLPLEALDAFLEGAKQ